MSEESYYTVDAYTSVADEQVATAAMLDVTPSASRGRPVAAVVAELLAGLGESLASSSGRLDAALAGTTGALLSLRSAPHAALLRASLECERPGLLDRVTHLVADAQTRALDAAGPSLAQAALAAATRELTAGIDAAALRLAVAERSVQLKAVSAALQECGFTVARAATWTGGRAALTAVGARRAAITVELDPSRGHLNMDIQGMAGLSCVAVDKQLRAAMARHGLTLSLRERRAHGDPAGGVLVRRLRAALGPATAKTNDDLQLHPATTGRVGGGRS